MNWFKLVGATGDPVDENWAEVEARNFTEIRGTNLLANFSGGGDLRVKGCFWARLTGRPTYPLPSERLLSACAKRQADARRVGSRLRGPPAWLLPSMTSSEGRSARSRGERA